MIYRIITTIGKHIGTEEALAGTTIGIGVYEAAYYWVIVSTLQVIEAGFGIVVVTAVADWVDMGNVIRVSLQRQDCPGRAFHRSHFSPGIILVGGDQSGIIALGLGIVASVDRLHVALQVLGVIVIGEAGVPSVFHPYAYNCPLFIVQEHQRAGKGAVRLILHLRQERGTHPVIVRICAVGVGLPGAQTVGIILVPGGFGAGFGGGKLPAVAPGECPIAAVEIGQGIADLVVGKGAGGGLAVMDNRT